MAGSNRTKECTWILNIQSVIRACFWLHTTALDCWTWAVLPVLLLCCFLTHTHLPSGAVAQFPSTPPSRKSAKSCTKAPRTCAEPSSPPPSVYRHEKVAALYMKTRLTVNKRGEESVWGWVHMYTGRRHHASVKERAKRNRKPAAAYCACATYWTSGTEVKSSRVFFSYLYYYY